MLKFDNEFHKICGKTITLTETIIQVFKEFPKNKWVVWFWKTYTNKNVLRNLDFCYDKHNYTAYTQINLKLYAYIIFKKFARICFFDKIMSLH